MEDLIENPPTLPLLIFDDECPLCVRFTQSIKLTGREHAPAFISLHHPQLSSLYPTLDLEECAQTIHFIDARGVLHKGPEAVSELVKLIPAVHKFAWLIDSAMGQKAVDFFYNSANRMRESLLNRCGACKKNKHHS